MVYEVNSKISQNFEYMVIAGHDGFFSVQLNFNHIVNQNL